MSITRICDRLAHGCGSILRAMKGEGRTTAPSHGEQILSLGLSFPDADNHAGETASDAPRRAKVDRSLIGRRFLTGGHASRSTPGPRICG